MVNKSITYSTITSHHIIITTCAKLLKFTHTVYIYSHMCIYCVVLIMAIQICNYTGSVVYICVLFGWTLTHDVPRHEESD